MALELQPRTVLLKMAVFGSTGQIPGAVNGKQQRDSFASALELRQPRDSSLLAEMNPLACERVRVGEIVLCSLGLQAIRGGACLDGSLDEWPVDLGGGGGACCNVVVLHLTDTF